MSECVCVHVYIYMYRFCCNELFIQYSVFYLGWRIVLYKNCIEVL